MSELTIEQQFELAKVKQTISNAGLEQMRELFVDLYVVMMKKDNITKDLLAQQWGMDTETVNRSPKVERWIDCGEC
jgi:hypothetical protein